jgi:hypothetical protein
VTSSAGFHSLDTFGGHGIQVTDVNGDGWLDVYVTNIAAPLEDRRDLLFVNDGANPVRFSEQSVELGVADDGFFEEVSEESHAAVFADLDNDGDYDLFNVHTWNGHNRLYRNDGQGRFTDLTESAGIDVTDLGSRGVSAADFNGDGLLDLLVSAWADAQPIIYWNRGDLRFERERIQGINNRPFANQGVATSDYDGDGKPDLALTAFEFIDNEGIGPVALLQNETERFFDATDFASLQYEQRSSDPGGTNGVTFSDVDNDGFMDVLIAGAHGSKLYLGNGEGRFHLGQRFEGIHYTGAFGDMDNDGDLDLYFAGESSIYLNDGVGSFAPRGGVGIDGVGADARSAVLADVNNDGALDVLVASKQGPNTMFLNQRQSGGWLTVSLVDGRGMAGAFGATVSLYRAGDRETLVGFREARAGTGYCSQDSPVLHFGVGESAPGSLYDVLVRFQDGQTVERTGVEPGQQITIRPGGEAP